MGCTSGNKRTTLFAGCSKWPSSKATGESKPEADPTGVVEDFDEPRTMLADFCSILLGLLDRFFSQRLVGLYIKSQFRLTFRKVTRDGKVFGIGRL